MGCDFVFLPWSDCSGQETGAILLGHSIFRWLGKLCDFILLVSELPNMVIVWI